MRFGEVTGNSELKQTFSQMADNEHLSHAILLCEESGGGAFALAVALAQYVNCQNRRGGDSCGSCPSCHKYNKLIHPDLHFAFPVSSTKKMSESDKKTLSSDYFIREFKSMALENPYFSEQELYDKIGLDSKNATMTVNESKRIFEKLSFVASEGLYKVMVIFLPEKMNPDAANKLLKLLEEPAARTLFLLISHSPEKVLQTIRSRCLRIDLKPLTQDEKASVAAARDESALREFSVSILKAASSKQLSATFPLWEALSEMGREKQKEMCLYLEEFIRKTYLVANGLDSLAELKAEEEEDIRAFAGKLQPTFYEKALCAVDSALAGIDGNVNAKLNFCNLCNCLLQSS